MFGMTVSLSCVDESTKHETVLPVNWLNIFSKSSCSANSVAETESPLHYLPGSTMYILLKGTGRQFGMHGNKYDILYHIFPSVARTGVYL